MRFPLFVMAMVLLASCNRLLPSAAKATPAPRPTGRITLEQRLRFANGSTTFQGTGFLVRSPQGAIVGVTSAHFLDRDGPRLVSLDLLAADARPVAACTRSLGLPGNEGIVTRERVDLRMDYLLLWPESSPDAAAQHLEVLSLDPRTSIPAGEPVWLPYMNGFDPDEVERLVAGRVVASEPPAAVIELNEELELMGHSGSPIISQTTGKVIGTLSRGGAEKGKSTLIIAPSHAILRALTNAEKTNSKPPLRDNIGKR